MTKELTDGSWLVMDGRYHTDPDSAIVLSACDTEQEAIEDAKMYGDCSVIIHSHPLYGNN